MQNFDEFEIRSAGAADFPILRKLAEQIWPGTYGTILSPAQIDYMIEQMYSVETLTRELAEGVRFRLILHREIPVGLISWGPYRSEPPTAKLHKLYLSAEFHGRGIGSLALTRTKAEVRAAGFVRLRLNVNRSNARAIRAYERNGFRKIESVDQSIGHGFFMNDFVM